MVEFCASVCRVASGKWRDWEKRRNIQHPTFNAQQFPVFSLSCNLSLAPGFSPVGAGDAVPSRFNGFVVAGAENG